MNSSVFSSNSLPGAAAWVRALLVASLLAFGWLSQCSAQQVLQPIGMVKTVTGQAFIDFNGQRVQAQPGLPVYLGSRLVTLPGASMGVTCKDDTLLAIGPDSQLSLDEYLFEPGQRRVGLLASLLQGTLNYVSGQIAKLRPDSVRVRTPTGMIGVRGTQFVVRVDPQ